MLRLVDAGIEDDQAPYWQPAKWTAKLRAMKSDDNLLLLRTNMGAGHGGESGFYDYQRETTYPYAFMLLTLGLEDANVDKGMATPVAARGRGPTHGCRGDACVARVPEIRTTGPATQLPTANDRGGSARATQASPLQALALQPIDKPGAAAVHAAVDVDT